jgi:N-acetylmuramoyl-L-alanine amidase
MSRAWGPVRAAALGVVGLLLAGCAGAAAVGTDPAVTTSPPPDVRLPGSPPATSPLALPPPAPPRRPGAAVVVVLDPGHNGGNAAHPEIINREVDAGLGQRKACNTVGTETHAGYPEHAFAFDVALRVRTALTRRGVVVLMTRPNDTGVGPCVDARARLGNARGAAAVVSIHADGAPTAGTGFHVIAGAAPASDRVVAAATGRLALSVRASLLAHSGLGYATYIADGNGLDHRSDLAGLNLSTRPTILVECGNMRNSADAALLSSAAGRARIAGALATGILAALAPH